MKTMKICDLGYPLDSLDIAQNRRFDEPLRCGESCRRAMPAKSVTRRPTIYQGRALETVGHAIEYLVDSGLYDPLGSINSDAIQILMRASQQIFVECPEAIPFGQDLRKMAAGMTRWLRKPR